MERLRKEILWIVQYFMTGAGVPKRLELNNYKYFICFV